MKRFLLFVLACLMTGCSFHKENGNSAIALRSKLQSSSGCSFHCIVTADYGEEITEFSMECVCEHDGDLSFTVTAPESIAGITGTVSQQGGRLTFDDKVLLVQLLVDGQLTPICAPWLMVRTILGGVIRGSGKSNNGSDVIYDDVFKQEPFQMYANLDENDYPALCEFVWQGRRILTVSVDQFGIL